MSMKQVAWIAAAVVVALWLTPAGVDAKSGKTTKPAKSDSAATATTATKSSSASAKAAPQPTRAGAGEDTSVPLPDPKAEPKMSMPAGQEGTTFGSLTVEGEDRIRIEFARPALDLKLDPRRSPGLELGDARAILEREQPDWVTPYLSTSALVRTPFQGRPWLDEMATGPVARFRPAVTSVERWRLAVVDSRGEQVVEFKGNGSPPKEVTWNGLNAAGKPCAPGLTYSYVFEAFDRAGNKRNFVGEGFKLPAYRRESPQSLMLLFDGERLGAMTAAPARSSAPVSPIVLEAASWINQAGRLQQPIQVKATARSFEVANAMSQSLAQQLGTLVLGDPARIQTQTAVESDAPTQGSVAITVGP